MDSPIMLLIITLAIIALILLDNDNKPPTDTNAQ